MYYMTGTGNSRRVAMFFSETASHIGKPLKVCPIEFAQRDGEVPTADGAWLGLVFPAHGFTAPYPMIRFAALLPRGNARAFVAVTRAGTKVGPWCLPGMEGTAAYLIALILVLKGYRMRGVQGFDMPSNWLALHWGISRANSECIIARTKPRAETFIQRVLSGRSHFGGFICLAIGLVLAPVSFGYLVFARFILSKLFFATDRCTSCGQCAQSCPHHAIRMRGKPSRPYWTFSCESCMRCMAYCPTKAIEAQQLLAVAMGQIVSIPLGTILLHRLVVTSFPGLGWVQIVLDYVAFLSLTWVTYWVFWWLNHVPVVRTFFAYATLTRWYRRYNEPNTTITDLVKRP